MATIGNSGSAITLAPGQTVIQGTVTGSTPGYAGFYGAVYGPGTQNDSVIITGAVENTSGGQRDAGIVLGAPGEIVNQGLISGGAGLVIGGYGGASYVQNANLIVASAGNGITVYGKTGVNNAGAIRAAATGADLRGGGVLSNEGKITGAIGVALATYYGSGSINNFGLIRGTSGNGAILAGSLTNHAGATIAGSASGLYLYSTGNANNAGVITGGSIGIDLANYVSAAVSIATTITNTGLIAGGYAGILLPGSIAAAVDIYNNAHGTISGTIGVSVGVASAKNPIVQLGNNGLIEGGATLHYGVIINTGSIYARGTAVNLEAGYVLNDARLIGYQTGIISAGISFTNSLLSGTLTKYAVSGAFTLANAGYIRGEAIAVDLLSGGVIRNAAQIVSLYGSAIASGAGLRLINRGRVDGATAAVSVHGNAYIYNSGNIISGGDALSASGTITLYNYGLIQSTAAAAITAAGGYIYNAGTIAGGLTTTGGTYLYNIGTIIDGAAAGLTLGGTIAGPGGVIALGAAPVTISGLVAAGEKLKFTGASQTLDLSNPANFKGKIANFALADTIDLTTIPFASITGETFSAGILTLTDTSGTLKLLFANPASLTGDTFSLFADGPGTGITLTAAAHAAAFGLPRHSPINENFPGGIHTLPSGWLTATHNAASPFIAITL